MGRPSLDCVIVVVTVVVNLLVALTVLVRGPVGVDVLVVEGDPDAVGVLEPAIVFVSVIDTCSDDVRLIEPVFVVDAVDVLLLDADFVFVLELANETVGFIVSVLVFVPLTVVVYVGLPVFVFDAPVVFVELEDPVLVFEVVIDDVPVLVKTGVTVNLGDFENDGEALAVFELAFVRLMVPLEVDDFVFAGDLLIVGDADGVFDTDVEEVCVLEAVVVLVAVAVPELVLDT